MIFCVVFFPSERQLYNFLLVQISFPPLSLSLSLSRARARAQSPLSPQLELLLEPVLDGLGRQLG